MEQETRATSKEQDMFALIAGFKASAMSVKDFCNHHRLSEPTYYYWQKKYRATQQGGNAKPGSFTLLKKDSDFMLPQSDPGALFAEYKGVKIYQQVSARFLKELIG